MSNEQYGFVRVHPTGELFAVRYFDNDGTITGANGPLASSEVKASELPNYEYNAEDAEWLMSEHFAGAGSRYSYQLLDDRQVEAIEDQSA